MRAVFLLAYLLLASLPLAWLGLRAVSADGGVEVAALEVWWRDSTRLAAGAWSVAEAALAAVAAVALAFPAAIGLRAWHPAARSRGVLFLWSARAVAPVLIALTLPGMLASALDRELGREGLAAAAHLLAHVPVAVAILARAADRVTDDVLVEAWQDGLGPLDRLGVLWWPACRGACALALLWCFAAGIGAGLAADWWPAPSAPVRVRATAGLSALLVAVPWAVLLAWWWVRASAVHAAEGRVRTQRDPRS